MPPSASVTSHASPTGLTTRGRLTPRVGLSYPSAFQRHPLVRLPHVHEEGSPGHRSSQPRDVMARNAWGSMGPAAGPSELRLSAAVVLEEALTTPGNLAGTYDRFHDYSFTNMILFRMQGLHEPVASFSRWNALGRHVVRGARAKEVIVPLLITERPPADETLEEKRERVARLVGFKVVRAVFGLSDTVGPEIEPQPTPGWDYQQALGKLGIREVPFDDTRGNLQGYSVGLEIAINPIAVKPTKTRFHEMAHVVLGHTLPHSYEDYATHRGVREFQAEAVAYIAMNELGQLDDETAGISRGYIQHWLQEEKPPEKAIQQAFSAADRILKSGRVAIDTVTETEGA